jgi:signal transduction histidine kinase
MAERTEMFGGTFTAEPTEAGGFEVTARFPG